MRHLLSVLLWFAVYIHGQDNFTPLVSKKKIQALGHLLWLYSPVCVWPEIPRDVYTRHTLWPLVIANCSSRKSSFIFPLQCIMTCPLLKYAEKTKTRSIKRDL